MVAKLRRFAGKFLVVLSLASLFAGMLAVGASQSGIAHAQSQAAKFNICQTYTRTQSANLSYGRLTANLCYNGSQAWFNGGPVSCSATVLPPFTLQNITWCGWDQWSGDYTEVGANYYVTSPVKGSFSQYVRMRLYKNGTVTTYGGF